MSGENCGNCLHWKLWPRDNTQGFRLCFGPLPEWVTGVSGFQATASTDGKNCHTWQAKR